MNKRLEDPFDTLLLPQHIEEELTEGVARVVAFHPSGNLLAAGCEDGSVAVYDFDTRGVCRKYKPHQKAVTCLAWTHQGLKLLTGSQDKAVVCQNLQVGPTVQESRISTGTPVARLDVNPHDAQQCVVSLSQGPPALLSFRDDSKRILPCIPPDVEGRQGKAGAPVEAEALIHRSGSLIFIAQGRGLISVLHAATFQFLDIIKIPGAPRIRSLSRDREGKKLLVNCGDKYVRMYAVRAAPEAPTGVSLGALPARLDAAAVKAAAGGSLLNPPSGAILELEHQFGSSKDTVTAWRCAQFTGDSEYVSAPVATDKEHTIHVWSAWNKQLAAVMQGPDMGVLDLSWHPCACVAAVVTAQGSIYIWARHHRERWDAFAPGFDELDNNVEYVEREDEFDILPEQQEQGKQAPESELDEDVDVFTLDQDDQAPPAPYLDIIIAPDPSPPREGRESSLELSSSEEQPKEGSKQRSRRSPRSRSPSAHRPGSQRPRSSRKQSHAGSEDE